MRHSFILIFIIAFTAGCDRGKLDRTTAERDSLRTGMDSIQSLLAERETSLEEFIESFNAIETNLDSIAMRQQIITTSAGREVKPSQKERINEHIEAINRLVTENKKTIDDLTTRLKRSRNQNAKLEKLIAGLKDEMSRKDEELAQLNARLEELNAQFAQLKTSFDSLSVQHQTSLKSLADESTSRRTAYYLVGRPKELREARVLNKEGGLLGVGRSSVLNPGFDNSKFVKIDFAQTLTIPVHSEKIKIITTHPSDSYRLVRDTDDKDLVKTIQITDPEKFWSVSRYLVISGQPAPEGMSKN